MGRISKIILICIIIIAFLIMLFKVRIRNVDVIGNKRNDRETLVCEIIGEPDKRVSAIVFIKDLFFKHKDIIYVDSYKISWITPFSISIDIKEKDAIAFIKKDIKNVYFDRDGIINGIESERRDDIPEVIGINFKSYAKGENIDVADEELLDTIIKISKTIKDNKLPLELIEIDNNATIKLYLGNISVDFGKNKNIDVKLDRLISIYPEIKDLKGILDLKDARTNMPDEQYIFKKTN